MAMRSTLLPPARAQIDPPAQPDPRPARPAFNFHYDPAPPFTSWITSNHLLGEPFILVDVGVQGGHHPRWNALGDRLHVLGFDPLGDVIDALNAQNPAPERFRYHHLGLGNDDGERLFERVANPYASAFLPTTATALDIGRDENGQLPTNWSSVQIRRLDTLYQQDVIPRADFLKMDCEGFEPEILRGAQNFLSNAGLIGIETETHFLPNPMSPRSHFVDVYEQIVPLGFEVHDLGFYRVLDRPNTFDFLFLGAEARDRRRRSGAGIDRIIKTVIVCELYGMHDCAAQLLTEDREALQRRFDVSEAMRLIGR